MSVNDEAASSQSGTDQPDESDGSWGAEFKHLFDSVEDLLKRVADVESADIQKVRAKVRVALMVAKSALDDGASQVRRQASRFAESTDGYVRDYPWQSAGIATLVGAGLGLLLTSRNSD